MNLEKEERDIKIIIYVLVPIAILAAIAAVLFFADHIDTWMP